jgi:GH18 family chitinase
MSFLLPIIPQTITNKNKVAQIDNKEITFFSVIGYYPFFGATAYNPSLVDYSCLTHIIHFATAPDSNPPYFKPVVSASESLNVEFSAQYAGHTNIKVQRTLIDSSNKYGVKVLLGIAAVGFYGGNVNAMRYVVSDSARTQLFVDNVIAYLNRKGYHGVDMNWEWPSTSDRDGFTRYMRILRRGLDTMNPRGVLTYASYFFFDTRSPVGGYQNSPLLNQYVDFVLPEFYGLSWGQMNANFGYSAALHKPSVAGYDAGTVSDTNTYQGAGKMAPYGLWKAGFDKGKIAPGFGLVYHFTGPTTVGQSNSGTSLFSYTVFNQGLADPQHATYGAYPEYWDDEAKVPYKRWTESGVNHFLTYENSNSFDEKIKWLKANGYGGVMIYDLSSIYINNNPSWGGIINYIGDRQKLLKDIKASAFAIIENPPITIPSIPALHLPANGATNQATTLTLSWSQSIGTQFYHLQVSMDSNFSVMVNNDSLLNNPSKEIQYLQYNTTYYWRVRATNSVGKSAWSSIWSFRTILQPTIPTVPILLSPQNNSTKQLVSPVLTWSAVTGATIYRVQVSTNPIFTTTVADDATITNTSKQLFELIYNTIYFWRVNATNSTGTSGWSTVFSFTTDSIRENPINSSLMSLYDDSLRTPWNNSSWSSTVSFIDAERVYEGSRSVKVVSNAWGALRLISGNWTTPINTNIINHEFFEFNVYNSTPGMSLRVAFENTEGQTFPEAILQNLSSNEWLTVSIPVSQLNPNQHPINFVTIQNYTGSTQTFYVDQIAFIGQEVLSSPVLVAPINNAADQLTNLTLTWGSVPNAQYYHLQVGTDSNFSTIILDDSTLTTTSKNLIGLVYSTKYYWRVKASSSTSSGPFSDVFNFITVAGKAEFTLNFHQLDFGKVIIGKSKTDSVTITNSGNILLDILSILSTNPEFSVTSSASTLSPGMEQKMYIKFTPQTRGIVNGLVLAVCETNMLADTITVLGDGLKPGKPVKKPESIVIKTLPGFETLIDSFLVYNSGDTTLMLSNIRSTNPVFSISSTLAEISKSDSQRFYITVNPSAHQDTEGYIIFDYDETSDSLHISLSLSTGVQADEYPLSFSLQQNFPNPFNPSTKIVFTIPENAYVTLKVYDVLGKAVATLADEVQFLSGRNEVQFDGRDYASGVYFYRVVFKVSPDSRITFTDVKRMLLAK